VSIDGRELCYLKPGESIQVSESGYFMLSVRNEGLDEDEWISDITDMLKWNQKYINNKHPNG
jgi:NAD kinase